MTSKVPVIRVLPLIRLEQINNQTTQLNQVIMEARSQSEISQNLEEKIRYKDQETELLYEEIAALKRDNDLLKNETNSKQADMGMCKRSF